MLSMLVVAAFGWRGGQAEEPGALTRTPTGRPVCWAYNVITLEPATSKESGATAMLEAALDAEIKAWSRALSACKAPRFRRTASRSRRDMRRDGRSVVVMKTASWCPDGAREAGECYERTSAAKTHVYPSSAEGACDELREADIELNGVDYRWSVDGEVPGTRSLRAILAHEFGHVLGLAEACGPTQPGDRADCAKHEPGRAVMYPAPVEEGREPVLEPTRGEAKTLCELYAPRTLVAPGDDPAR